MNRRTFLASLFSGVVVTATVTVERLVTVYHEHDHYVAQPGIYNIWYVHDELWYLLSDSAKAPFEFRSEKDAQNYARKCGYVFYSEQARTIAPEGVVSVRPAPTVIHDMKYLRQTEAEIDRFLIGSDVESELGVLLTQRFLACTNGAEQNRIWISALETKPLRSKILKLQGSKDFSRLIRSVYCTQSYHSCLAKLDVFRPPYDQNVYAKNNPIILSNV